jgi:hypothetical protein
VILDLCLSLEGRGPSEAIEALLLEAGKTPRRWRRQPLRVWLSGALARPFLFGPMTGLRGWRESQAAAAALASSATGLIGPCAAELESDPAVGAVLATAVEQSVLDALHTRAQTNRLRVVSIRPMWTRAIESASRGHEQQLLCCRDADALTVLAFRTETVVFAATYSPAPDEAESARLLRRLRASLGFADDEVFEAQTMPLHVRGLPAFGMRAVPGETEA